MDLEQKSIERIKMASEMSLHHYGKPLICTYSGGKDSDVMLEAIRATGKETYWKSAENVFRWWMEDPDIDGQLSMEFGEE